MISLRHLTAIGGLVALLSTAAMAQSATDGAPRGQAAGQGRAGAPRAAKAARPGHGVIRPAGAVPPERIRAEPVSGARPQIAPLDDPRSVEETKAEPDATDR